MKPSPPHPLPFPKAAKDMLTSDFTSATMAEAQQRVPLRLCGCELRVTILKGQVARLSSAALA
jgi:hypothetical protein